MLKVHLERKEGQHQPHITSLSTGQGPYLGGSHFDELAKDGEEAPLNLVAYPFLHGRTIEVQEPKINNLISDST